MHLISDTYHRLLEDIGTISGFSEIRGSCFEGLEWALIVAPALDKQLLDKLEGREIDTPISIPLYLQGIWDHATSSRSDSWHSVRLLRQLFLFAYKAELNYTYDQENVAYQKWEDLNRSCSSWCLPRDGRALHILDAASRLCQQRLASFREREVIPFHGPGAVYIKGSKHRWTRWYSTIDSIYGYHSYFHTSTGFDPERDEYVNSVEDEIPCRASAVPKDSRGPRLVFVHPAEAVWVQQGVRVALEDSILSSQKFGRIEFDDQSINGRMALLASSIRDYATLDMSDASDRVPDILVQRLFGLRNYKRLGCCRASVAETPLGKFPIAMYAPMGNATTFPVESLVFWALSTAIQQLEGLRPDSYVFGDDLIIPSAAFSAVVEGLSLFNLQVNQRKSFNQGYFRESCGVDAYRGFNVTPIRWKLPLEIKSDSDIMGLSELAVRLRRAGYHESALCIYQYLTRYSYRRWGRPLGLTNDPHHGALAEFVDCESQMWLPNRSGWDPDLQYHSTRLMVLEYRSDTVEHDWNHVLSSLTSLQRFGRSNRPATTPFRKKESRPGRWKSVWRPIL